MSYEVSEASETERMRGDGWERWEWNIDHHAKSLYIFSLYRLTGIHNSRYTLPSNVGGISQTESEMEILSILT